MSGQNFAPNMTVVIVLLWSLGGLSCASIANCPPSDISNEVRIFDAARSSGGAALTFARLDVTGNRITYRYAADACVELTEADLQHLSELIRNEPLSRNLDRIAARKLAAKYGDLPHVVIDIGAGPVFIPARLLVAGDLRNALQPIDDFFARRLGRAYRLRLLPTASEAEDLRRLGPIDNDE